ncbi:uncharacterized protein YgbK (DUF1537 family) [Haloactinospora alba]|uniref:Uncharacterized protein YgbK (DUF1537 family) n=1 Tax=Haloactinospora alba TaxID=405555 RepID=A0A543N925_9ACTN|nr:four-carbon acid sugar kinase family protein [Haloactinospora alba]TQN28318.1 uncharacterized protein YgbK (DUF1537 family) [Haloactinospora alba]
MTPTVSLIADDLTGANDAAVRFLRSGWPTRLQLDTTADATGAEVVAVSTDSRSLSPADAGRTVARHVRHARDNGARHLYKKIDSTLRGPLAAETEAARAAWAPTATAVVCPAFPAAGRTVEGGTLLVDGRPAHETALASDPVTPVRESHIPTLLGAPHVRLESAAPAANARALAAAGPTVVVDAASTEDLDRLAAAVARLGPDAIPVGSAGLAGAMAGAWADSGTCAPALVVVTSLHATTRAQVEHIARESPEAVAAPTAGTLTDDTAWRAWSAEVDARLARTSDVLVLLAPDDRARGLDPDTLARRFGALAAHLAQRHHLAGFVATGGDGARTLIDELGATGIELNSEVAAGIPIGTLSGGPLAGHPIVTKAGGFGDPAALRTAASAVRHRRKHT